MRLGISRRYTDFKRGNDLEINRQQYILGPRQKKSNRNHTIRADTSAQTQNPLLITYPTPPVCTENLNPNIMVMKPAEDRA